MKDLLKLLKSLQLHEWFVFSVSALWAYVAYQAYSSNPNAGIIEIFMIVHAIFLCVWVLLCAGWRAIAERWQKLHDQGK